jgi:HlyD family secretion protein
MEHESFCGIWQLMTKTRTILDMKKFLTLLSLFIICGQFLTGCGSINKSTPTPAIPIQTGAGAAAEAKVIPKRSAALSFASSGKVEFIKAFEGSTVKKGDLIARLEGGERAHAAIAAAELQVASAQKALDDLNEKASLAAADAEMKVAQAALDLKDAREKRDDLNYKRVNQYMLEGIQAQLIMAESAVDDAETAYSFVQDRGEDDPDRARAMAYLSQTRLARDQIQRNLQYAEGPPDARDIAEADAKVSKALADLSDAQRTYDRRKSGPDTKDLTIAMASLKNAQAQADAARATLVDLEMTAPFDGLVIVNDLEVGEFATAGKVLVGDISSWQIETTDLKEVDIVGIQSGQPVTVKFDAIPGLELPGTVNRIKGFGITVRGDNTYIVTVDLNRSDPRLLWNMTARVTFPSDSSALETQTP